MNRRIFIVAALSLTAAFTSCKKDIAVSNVTLNYTSYTLEIGGTLILEATVEPKNATNQEVEWESDKPNIASVDDSGNVTANAKGLAKITVTTKDGNHKATCEITVNDKTFAVTGVTLNYTSYTLDIGGKLILEATVVPQNATNQEVEWGSDKPNIASVDNSGNVTANAEGLAKITVTTKDGNHQATCAITVNPKPVPFIHFWADKANAVYPNDLTVGYDVGSFATFLKRGYAAFGNIHTVELAVEAEAALVTDDREVFFKMGSAALTPSGVIKKGQGTAKFTYDVEIVVTPNGTKDVVFSVDFDKTKGFIPGAENRKSYTLACTNSDALPKDVATFLGGPSSFAYQFWDFGTNKYYGAKDYVRFKFIALIHQNLDFNTLPVNITTPEKKAEVVALNAKLRSSLEEYKGLNSQNPQKYPPLYLEGTTTWIDFPVYE